MHEFLFDLYCPQLGIEAAEAFVARHSDWKFHCNVRDEKNIVLALGDGFASQKHNSFIKDILSKYKYQIQEIKQNCDSAVMRFAVFRDLDRSFVISIDLEPETLHALAELGLPFEISVYPNSDAVHQQDA